MDYLELAKQSTTKPSDFGWFGRDDMFETWGHAGIDRNRDSAIRDISNYESVIAHLQSEYGDEYDELFDTYGASHWACGWVDRLIVKVRTHAICETCEQKIYFINDYETVRNWQKAEWWWSIDPNAPKFREKNGSCSGNPEEHYGFDYHTPSELKEDEITEAFKEVVNIAIDLRESYSIFDDQDFSERQSIAETEWVDFVVNDILCPTGSFDADKCLSWLWENDYYSDSYDSDDTPLWDRNDLAVGVWMTHQEDPTEDFWIEWVENNPEWVGKRMRQDQIDAGQLSLEV